MTDNEITDLHRRADELGVLPWARDLANSAGALPVTWADLLRFVVACGELGCR